MEDPDGWGLDLKRARPVDDAGVWGG
jgi:hypothetical protein